VRNIQLSFVRKQKCAIEVNICYFHILSVFKCISNVNLICFDRWENLLPREEKNFVNDIQ
jgi:hypothetical protein